MRLLQSLDILQALRIKQTDDTVGASDDGERFRHADTVGTHRLQWETLMLLVTTSATNARLQIHLGISNELNWITEIISAQCVHAFTRIYMLVLVLLPPPSHHGTSEVEIIQ